MVEAGKKASKKPHRDSDTAFLSAKKLQNRRRDYLLYGCGVGLFHMLFCIACFYLEILSIPFPTLAIFFGIVWFGNLVFLVLVLTGENRKIARRINETLGDRIAQKIKTGDQSIRIEEKERFNFGRFFNIDAGLFFPFSLWLGLSFIGSLFFIKDSRLCVMMCFMMLMFIGSLSNLRKEQFKSLAVLGSLGYLASTAWVVQFHAEVSMLSTGLMQEIVQWGAVSVLLALLTWFCIKTIKLNQTVAQKNVDLDTEKQKLHKTNLDLNSALRQIQSMARCDHLTGLYNRHYTTEKLAEQKALAARGGYDFVVCYLDLDHFKQINDTFGHNIGDEVLKAYARICKAQVRNIDICARFGGEEFVVILVQTQTRAAKEVAERIRENIQNYDFNSIAKGLSVTVSIGLTQYSAPEPIDEALTRSDAALYQAKRSGRNKVVAFDPPAKKGKNLNLGLQ